MALLEEAQQVVLLILPAHRQPVIAVDELAATLGDAVGPFGGREGMRGMSSQ